MRRFLCLVLGHKWRVTVRSYRCHLPPWAHAGEPAGCLAECERCHSIFNDLPTPAERYLETGRLYENSRVEPLSKYLR